LPGTSHLVRDVFLFPFYVGPSEVVMKKSKSNIDLSEFSDKQYKTTLLLVKLVSSLSVEVHALNDEVKRLSTLVEKLVANNTLEEEPV